MDGHGDPGQGYGPSPPWNYGFSGLSKPGWAISKLRSAADVSGPCSPASCSNPGGPSPPTGSRTPCGTDIPRVACRPPCRPTYPTFATPSNPRGSGGRRSGVIGTVPGGYRLVVTASTVDAARFEELVAAGRSALDSDPAAASDLLKQALALWRGDVLADLSMDGYVAPVATRLEELRGAATELWAEAEMALGHDVLSTLDNLVTRYPLREHLAAVRMLALYRAGRQADALTAYRELRQTLDDELGIQPSAEVESLHRRVLQQDPSLDLAPPGAGGRDVDASLPRHRNRRLPTVSGPPRSRWHWCGRPVGAGRRSSAVVLVAVTALAGLGPVHASRRRDPAAAQQRRSGRRQGAPG